MPNFCFPSSSNYLADLDVIQEVFISSLVCSDCAHSVYTSLRTEIIGVLQSFQNNLFIYSLLITKYVIPACFVTAYMCSGFVLCSCDQADFYSISRSDTLDVFSYTSRRKLYIVIHNNGCCAAPLGPIGSKLCWFMYYSFIFEALPFLYMLLFCSLT